MARLPITVGVLLAVPMLVALGLASGADRQPAPIATVAPLKVATEPIAGALAEKADRRAARERAERRKRREAARVAEARRLRRSRTVRGAVRRAWLARNISRKRYEQMRSTLWRAERDAKRLTGTRRAELGAALRMAEGLAARRILTASRLEAVMLTLRRNREFWTTRALPKPGARVTFRRDPVVFQYYSGRGLAIMPLANFGKANALAGSCVRAVSQHRCRPAALRKLLDRMLLLGSQRGGFLTWEYFIAFGGGAPPWISGMAQATAAQAFARGHRALGDERYEQAARRALGAFDRSPPVGVAVSSAAGRRYTMYSFAPALRIFNGELQALIGLRDVARILRNARAGRLYARAEPMARRSVPAIDTGAWSLYSQGGRESTLNYHWLVGTFLDRLCSRTGTRTYCSAGRRFADYVVEPPRVSLRTPRKLRARRLNAITFKLSKISRVMVTVRDRRGRVELARGMRLPRGRHSIPWKPKLIGRHTVRIVAIGPASNRREIKRTWYAKRVKKKRTAKQKAAAKKRAETRRKAAAKKRKEAAKKREAAAKRRL